LRSTPLEISAGQHVAVRFLSIRCSFRSRRFGSCCGQSLLLEATFAFSFSYCAADCVCDSFQPGLSPRSVRVLSWSSSLVPRIFVVEPSDSIAFFLSHDFLLARLTRFPLEEGHFSLFSQPVFHLRHGSPNGRRHFFELRVIKCYI